MSLNVKFQLKKGVWLINDKLYKNCNRIEQNFFNEMLKNVKIENLKN